MIYHKLSAANYYLSSGGQKSKLHLTGLKSRCRQGSLPSGGSGGEFPSRLFQFLGATCIPWLMDPFHLESTDVITLTSASIILSPLNLTLLHPFHS